MQTIDHLPTPATLINELGALDDALKAAKAAKRAITRLADVQDAARVNRPSQLDVLVTDDDVTALDDKIRRLEHAKRSARTLHAASEQYLTLTVESTKRTSRKTRHRLVDAEMPDHLRPMGAHERVLSVMTADPERTWNRTDIAAAAYVGNVNTLGGTLTKLKAAGSIVNTSDGWQLAPEHSAETARGGS